MKELVRSRSVSMNSERRHSTSAGEVEYAPVALQPAAAAIAKFKLKPMFVAIPRPREVLCMIAAWNGASLEPPYGKTCMPTLKSSTLSAIHSDAF